MSSDGDSATNNGLNWEGSRVFLMLLRETSNLNSAVNCSQWFPFDVSPNTAVFRVTVRRP